MSRRVSLLSFTAASPDIKGIHQYHFNTSVWKLGNYRFNQNKIKFPVATYIKLSNFNWICRLYFPRALSLIYILCSNLFYYAHPKAVKLYICNMMWYCKLAPSCIRNILRTPLEVSSNFDTISRIKFNPPSIKAT